MESAAELTTKNEPTILLLKAYLYLKKKKKKVEESFKTYKSKTLKSTLHIRHEFSDKISIAYYN